MILENAREIAKMVQEIYRPYCERVEIAGSIRREKSEVNDIELVALPKRRYFVDLFQMKHETLETLASPRGILQEGGAKVLKTGPRYTQFALVQGIKLDLFVVRPPAQWGVIMAIRTGPAKFSKWLVTKRSKGGALPSNMRIKSGALWIGNGPEDRVEIDTEREFFQALALEWVAPEQRIGKLSGRSK